MHFFLNFFSRTLVFIFVVSCSIQNKEHSRITSQIEAIRSEFAPDKRVALFQVEVSDVEGIPILKGESNLPNAVDKLRERLENENIDFRDSIQILPSEAFQNQEWAVVTISVANLRSNPKHSAELATQATLGTPVKVLKKKGSWYYIQTPDKYLSWVDHGGIALMDNERFKQWQETEKLIYLQTYGHAFFGEDEQQRVSDLVAGSVLEILKYGAKHTIVRFPDGRQGFVRNAETEDYSQWLENLDATGEDLVATSQEFMGVPYLWGGTSTKGMDCSGFTKTIYFLNGMVIPRDASQQVHTGKAIDSVQNFDNLQKGDLLFFGTKATDSTKEKVVHVGMWIGNNAFIHASERIRIGSMDPEADNYDEKNRNRYLRTQRILKQKDEGLISLLETPLFKD